MNIYLDTCALNRLTDDQSQPRIQVEADAIVHILDMMSSGDVRWIASSVLLEELARSPKIAERTVLRRFTRYASEIVTPSPDCQHRAHFFRAAGYGNADALHLALAEQAAVTALITVDDRFLRRAARGDGTPAIVVVNPIDWLRRRRPWLLKR